MAVIQGLFYFLTGVWPLISIDSFQKVTGPKTDHWLVKTVGALIAVIGAVLFLAGYANNVTSELILLAVASSAALAIVDVNYALKGVISRVYLLDSVVEAAIISLWLLVLFA